MYFTSVLPLAGQPFASSSFTLGRSPLLAAAKNTPSISCTGHRLTQCVLPPGEPVRDTPHHSAMSCSASVAGTSHRRHWALKRKPAAPCAVVTCSANLSCLYTHFALSLTNGRRHDLNTLALLHHGRCKSHLPTLCCTHDLMHQLAILYACSNGKICCSTPLLYLSLAHRT